MPKNVEIKARVEDLEGLKKLAKKISGEDGTLIEQEDTFYNSPQGYLKLRELKDNPAQLIYYERPKENGPKVSDFHVTQVEKTEELKFTLEKVCGLKGVVKKQRMLYMVGQTRVHCDRVDQLGDFMELEVCLQPGQSAEEGNAIARDLMQKLNIDEESLMTGAYMEHILKRQELTNGHSKQENGVDTEVKEQNGEGEENASS